MFFLSSKCNGAIQSSKKTPDCQFLKIFRNDQINNPMNNLFFVYKENAVPKIAHVLFSFF